MSDWTTIQHEQSGLVMVPLHQAERVRDERDRLKADIAELKDWKESALSMLNGIDLQAVAHELNIPYGGRITPSIMPGIRALKARIATLETLDSFLCHLNLDCCEEACTCGLDKVTDSADLPRCEQFPG